MLTTGHHLKILLFRAAAHLLIAGGVMGQMGFFDLGTGIPVLHRQERAAFED